MGTYWAHVIRCAHKCFGKTGLMIQHSSQSKITKFNVVLSIKEYVCWLQISVEDNFSIFVSAVALLQSKDNLIADLPYKVFFKVATVKKSANKILNKSY